jgi:hypothetical protein
MNNDCSAKITLGDKTIQIYSKEKTDENNFDTMLENIELLKQKTDEYLQTLLDQNKGVQQAKEEEIEDDI